MNGRVGWLVMAILTIATVPAVAQWLNVPTKGIPRTQDGKPDLSAPAPRKPDGKPDLSGIWIGDAKSQKYQTDLTLDFKPNEFPILPWAAALTNQRTQGRAGPKPGTSCLPDGVPVADAHGLLPAKIIQEPDLVVILYEAHPFRQIFLDGRTLSKDPNPTWMGYSVGRWEGDSLVVETTGFNGRSWLDFTGHPSTDALHLTERFQRRDFGHLNVQLTINDAKAYTEPWSVALTWQLVPDTELMEYVCNENEKDLKHMVGK